MIICTRGLPGSGKTTWAKEQPNAKVLSADDWMVDVWGNYLFNPSKLEDCHRLCFEAALEWGNVATPRDILIIANTNLNAWEISPYAAIAKMLRVEFKVVTIDCGPEVAFGRQIHKVPRQTFDRMHAQFLKCDVLPWWKHEVVSRVGDTCIQCLKHVEACICKS